jgi:membrane protein implicated in regulation of membrane protease activity
MKSPVGRVAKGIAILAIVLIVLAAVGAAVMLLWNALVPALFHGPTLQYWQALGLLILSRLLFGGLRGGWHGHWRQRMWRERWEQMTPEERARLRERFLSRCGRAAGPAEAAPKP